MEGKPVVDLICALQSLLFLTAWHSVFVFVFQQDEPET